MYPFTPYVPMFIRNSWWRHCATNRKVAGSIPDGFIKVFHRHNPSDGTMTLGLNCSLAEMSTSNTSWSVKATGE
jgi:hypothetical protein